MFHIAGRLTVQTCKHERRLGSQIGIYASYCKSWRRMDNFPPPHHQITKNFLRHVYCSGLICNHYKTLGLDKTAKAADVKNAYFKLTKKYHPDAKDSDNFDEFLKIAEAYEVLGNPTSRRQYDFQQFGNSSDLNRFESGEYEIPNTGRTSGHGTTNKNQQHETSGPKIDNTIKMALTPEARRILDYLIGVLATTCIAMYFLSRHQRNKQEEGEDD